MTTKTMSAVLLAIAGAAAFLPSTTSAAIVYADGDLILGFRATGNQGATTDYLVDLGSASSILSSTVPITFSIGAIGTDLTSIFGDWSNRGDVFWSVSGVKKSAGLGFSANTMFATRSDAVDGPLGTNTTAPWLRPSAQGAGAPALKLQSQGTQFGLGGNGTQNESVSVPGALIQPVGVSNSYAFFQAGVGSNGAAAYGFFADANGIEGNFANGASSSVLDLYRVNSGSSGADSLFAGNITITNGGSVTFTPTPEPTSAVTLALGATVLTSLRRRRSTAPLV